MEKQQELRPIQIVRVELKRGQRSPRCKSPKTCWPFNYKVVDSLFLPIGKFNLLVAQDDDELYDFKRFVRSHHGPGTYMIKDGRTGNRQGFKKLFTIDV